MSKITRREFLRLMVTSLGAITFEQFLSACDRQETPSLTATQQPNQPTPAQPIPKGTANPTARFLPTDTSPAPTNPTSPTDTSPALTALPSNEMPYLAVARNGEPEEMVRRVVAALGGIEKFVPKGAQVIIKPNICVAYHTYEYAATTNPWVVGGLVKLCYEGGAASVRVLDFPFGGSADQAYAKSGIADQVKAAGGEMVIMAGFKFKNTDIPQGLDMKKCAIYDDILKADVLIDVPIAKHHGLARLTLGMKNLMGVIEDRSLIHHNLGQRLADLSSRIRPQLTVIDAVRILMANGPTGGNLDDVKKIDTVIASTDIVAADSFGATLFGLKPDELTYIKAGTAMGLGRSDLENLRIEEINLAA